VATGPRGAAGARDDVEGCDGVKEGKSEPEGEKPRQSWPRNPEIFLVNYLKSSSVVSIWYPKEMTILIFDLLKAITKEPAVKKIFNNATSLA